MDRRSCRRASSRRSSVHRSLSSEALLTFMLSAVAISIGLQKSFSTPGPPLPMVVTFPILFCFIAYLINVALSSQHQHRRPSRLFRVFGFHAILFTLASLLSIIVLPELWLIPYILVTVFVFCHSFPLKWLYRGLREVGAFKFFIRRPTSACETPSPPPPPQATNV